MSHVSFDVSTFDGEPKPSSPSRFNADWFLNVGKIDTPKVRITPILKVVDDNFISCFMERNDAKASGDMV